jgi:phenylalanine-4-hydroxylase
VDSVTSNLPKHLKRYVVQQNYEKYTPLEHATWRFIMRQNRSFFSEHAVPVYLQGLKQTGIPIDRIPNIQEMDVCLSAFGYGAVGVCGFIPPAIFLEFQALGIMPIATDMRTIDHIAYTPAPDIVHEAAGHVPIVIDPSYRNFLSQYGQAAFRAIFSDEDVRLYEAIRYLSDIKENPDTDPKDIALAQKALDLAAASVSFTSESAKLARMGWWTIEYGLVGTVEKPKIFGAGLLSSVGESQNCLSSKVKKIPLSIACVEQGYDITEPQPQLFVAPSLNDLPTPLHQLEATMAFKRGGISGCQTAIQAKTINSIQLDSGVEIGGVLIELEARDAQIDFVRFSGPCQLGSGGTQLPNQGTSQHPHGFSTPLGFWQKKIGLSPHRFDNATLRGIGIEKSRQCRLEFVNGFVVSGKVCGIQRAADQSLQIISWVDCTVKRGDQTYFQPDWGVFDMPVGSSVVSVFSGPPDRDAYGNYEIGVASSSPGRTSAFSSKELALFDAFSITRKLRQSIKAEHFAVDELHQLTALFTNRFQEEWLLGLELIELHKKRGAAGSAFVDDISALVQSQLESRHQSQADLFSKGLKLATVED